MRWMMKSDQSFQYDDGHMSFVYQVVPCKRVSPAGQCRKTKLSFVRLKVPVQVRSF